MADLKNLLSKSIKKLGLSEQVATARAMSIFSQLVGGLVGQDLVRKIRPLYLKNQILVVASLSENAVIRLRGEEDKIIDQINKKLEEEVVKEIQYLT